MYIGLYFAHRAKVFMHVPLNEHNDNKLLSLNILDYLIKKLWLTLLELHTHFYNLYIIITTSHLSDLFASI